MYNHNSQEGNFPQGLPGNPSIAYVPESVAEKRPRIQHPNEMYHNFISAPMVVPAVYNPSNGTYSFISNIPGPGPGAVPLRTDFADSSEDGSNSETQVRSNYMCRKCNKPKKGHICTMQQQSIIRRAAADPTPPSIPLCTVSSSSSSSQAVAHASTESPSGVDAIVQVEIDPNMTVRELGDLSVQGLTSSYESMTATAIAERRAQNEKQEPQPPLDSFSF